MNRKVLFRVYRDYFDRIRSGDKTYEARPATLYWTRVASRGPTEAVFQCGRLIHRREIVGIRFGAPPPVAVEDPKLVPTFRGRQAVIFDLGSPVAERSG